MSIPKEKTSRFPFSKLLCVLYTLCFSVILILCILVIFGVNADNPPKDVPTATEPIPDFPTAPTVITTPPTWFPAGLPSPLFSLPTDTAERQLIPELCINLTLPAFATYAEPINGRYLKLTSENLGGYSYIPDDLCDSPTVLMDMQSGEVFGLEQTIAGALPPDVSKSDVTEQIDVLDFQKNDRWCLFRLFEGVEEAQEILPRSRVGIFDAENKSVRLLPALNGLDFVLLGASDDYHHLVLRLVSEEETGKILWLNTLTEEKFDISRYNGSFYPISDCSFSPTDRYILCRFEKKTADGADWILVDTEQKKARAGKGQVQRFLQNDGAMLICEDKEVYFLSLPHGTKTALTSEKDPNGFFLRVKDGVAELVFGDGTHSFPLFSRVQSYVFWREYLFLRQKNSPYILCYSQDKHEAFRIDIADFLKQAGDHEDKRFDFAVVNGGKNILLRVSYPTESTLYPDLETPFIDEAYQLQPIIEAVGMDAFAKFENTVYEKYSSSRRNAKPPLYDFIMGLKLAREALPQGAYTASTLDAIYAETEEEMLTRLCSPYALYASGKVMLYGSILKMSEESIRNAALPLSVYQKYFKTIHTVFVRYDTPEKAADFLEQSRKFEEKYKAAFA